jgi:hypothetical protein
VVGVPPELEGLVVGAAPRLEELPVADFDVELQAATPATKSAAATAHIARFALNTS